MPVYFDTSVLLSILLGDIHQEKALHFWEKNPERISSILFEAEAWIVLNGSQIGKKKSIKTILTPYMEEINLLNIDRSILDILKTSFTVAECRTLDALHLATALYIQKQVKEKISICSFDKRLIQMAQNLGCTILS